MNPFRQRRLRQRIAEARPRLYRLAWAWTHDSARAEDLVQDALERALRRIGDLRDTERLDAWLARILLNCQRDYSRRHHEETGLELEADDEGQTGPEVELDRADLIARTRMAMARLSGEHREVLTLVELAELSYADVANVLDVPTGTVMSRLARARTKLRMLLEAEAKRGEIGNIVRLRRRS